jgi:hypothetical protein
MTRIKDLNQKFGLFKKSPGFLSSHIKHLVKMFLILISFLRGLKYIWDNFIYPVYLYFNH